MIEVRNLTLIKSDKFILVDNYKESKKHVSVWNCPLPTNEPEDRNSSTIGVWKIKQLKQ